MTLVYITCKDEKEAEKISLHLLRKRIIACANIFPVKSFYWWNKRIANEKEYVAILKTNNKNFKKVESEVKRIHSYKIPCILKLNSSANSEYELWASREMR